jgi:hypothetical protein
MNYEKFTRTDIHFLQDELDQIIAIFFNPNIDLQGREMIMTTLINEMGGSEISIEQAADAVEILHEIIAEREDDSFNR